MSEPKKDTFRDAFTERVIDALENGTAPWVKPWEGRAPGFPRNAITGKPYRGINAINLIMLCPSDDPRFVTYKQAEAQGWQVRKGSRGYQIEVWKPVDKNHEIEDKKTGETKLVREQRMGKRVYTVFHASQIDGIPQIEQTEPREVAYNEVAEALLAKMDKPPILHDQLDQAFYLPIKDTIHVPPREAFKDEGHYWSTVFHEIGHSTGAAHRLDREGITGHHPFGSVEYAKEELRAEIGSWMLSVQTGIPHHPENHAAYVKSWLKTLHDDRTEIFKAIKDAEKITDYLVGHDRAAERATEQGQAHDNARAQPTQAADPAAELRALWTAQGVSTERQAELQAQIAAKAQPGAKVGPFVIGTPTLAKPPVPAQLITVPVPQGVMSRELLPSGVTTLTPSQYKAGEAIAANLSERDRAALLRAADTNGELSADIRESVAHLAGEDGRLNHYGRLAALVAAHQRESQGREPEQTTERGRVAPANQMSLIDEMER